MGAITDWPLFPWTTGNIDVLRLAEPREDAIAYTRGYLAVAGILEFAKKRVTEWQVPGTLLPDRSPPHLPVFLDGVSWNKSQIAMAEINRPASIVTLQLKDNLLLAHTMPATSGPKYDFVRAVRTTVEGDIWHVARAGGDPAISRSTIGRIRPGTDLLEYWPLPIGWASSRGLAVEAGGRAIWTTGLLAYGDFRHAVMRLDPVAGELTHWALPDPDPTPNQAAIDNVHRRGPVVVAISRGDATSVWWLLTSPVLGDSGRLVHLNPVSGEALDYGPVVPPPGALGSPLALTLDRERRPWLTFGSGAVATVTRPSCGRPIVLKRRSVKVKGKEARVKVRKATVAPTTAPVVPVQREAGGGENGCFRTMDAGVYPFDISGGGLPLAGKVDHLFVSNGVDRILQFKA